MVAIAMRASPTKPALHASTARRRALTSARALLGAVCLTALAPSPAQAVEGPETAPILDDLDRGRRLSPPPGTLGGEVTQTKEPEAPETPRVARDVLMIVAHGRWSTVPDFMLDMFFVEHPSGVVGPSIAVALETGDLDDTIWSFELNWTPYVPNAGNWLELGADTADATYAESGIHFISIDASYRNQIRFTQGFRAFVGGGLGIGVLAGNFDTAEVLPTCESPVSECAHWPRSTNGTADLPTRIAPVLHFLAGLEVDLGAGLTLRAQGGFRNAFYAGLSVGKSL
ncbi:MAG TPA: hypothetical protein PK095_14755 [Myxococcota bacterium]|nr:hypothetical protein [Myxococcota bacterium]